MKMILQGMGLVGLLSWMGCATLPNDYRPQTVGALENGATNQELSLQLVTRDPIVQFGKPVIFQVVIRNISPHACWFPAKPQQGFFWTLPNGRHDGYFFDREQTRFFNKNDCVLLQPGHALVLPGLVDTADFRHPGITEFKAEVDVAQNTNPALSPFWSGRAFSNSFGVQVIPCKAPSRFAQSASSPVAPSNNL